MAKSKGRAPGGPKKAVVGGVKIGMQKGGVKKGGAKKTVQMPKGAPSLKQKLAAARGPQVQQRAPGGPKAAPKPSGRHTLLLKQDQPAASSRSWSDFASVNDAIDGFISSYEAKLRNLNPGQKTLTYSVADLQQYVDSMHDVSLMVSDPQTKQYGACSRRQEKQKLLPALFALAQLTGCTCTMLAAPKGKAFLKQMLMQRLKSAVA